MAPVDELLRRTGFAFRARWRVFLAIMAIEVLGRYAILLSTVVAVFVALLGAAAFTLPSLDPAAIADAAKNAFSMMPSIGLILAALATVILGLCALALFETWILASVFYAAENQTESVSECLKAGMTHFNGFGWVLTLWSLVVMAGLVFFVLPGLVLAMLYWFAPVVYFREGKRGWAAMSRAREWLTGGRLAPVALRLGVMLALVMACAMIASLSPIPFSSDLFGIASVPFAVLFQIALSRELDGGTPA